jgi:hypothetical protein
MRIAHLPNVGIAVVVSLALIVGCGEKPSADASKDTEGTVKGNVRINGAPATEGEIIFGPAANPDKDESRRTAPINKDGTYEAKAPTGLNSVRLGGSLTKKMPRLRSESRNLDVKPGENAFDFDLEVNIGK